MPTPTRSGRQRTGRMSALAAASMTGVVGYALRNSVRSVLRMRAMASTTFTVGAPLTFRLGDEHRNAARGLGLVFLVRRVRRDPEPPPPGPRRRVLSPAPPPPPLRGAGPQPPPAVCGHPCA